MKVIIFFTLLLCTIAGCGKKGLDYGPYSIGRDLSWFPLELGSKTANLNAFTNALILEIGKTEGAPLQIVNIDWGQLFEVLDSEEVAAIFTTLPQNVVTLEKYTFSLPMILLGPVLIVRADSAVSSLNDLGNKIVAVNQFDDSVLVAQEYPAVIIQLYDNKPTILKNLADGEIDGVLMPTLDAQMLVPSLYEGRLKIVTPPLNDKAIRLITLRGINHSIIKNFNSGLKRAIKSGKFDELRSTFQIH